MGVLTKLGFILLAIVIVYAFLYFYGKQITTTPGSSLLNNIITTTVLPYYENATVKSDLAQIEKVIPANEIKAVRTFVNPSTNFTLNLNLIMILDLVILTTHSFIIMEYMHHQDYLRQVTFTTTEHLQTICLGYKVKLFMCSSPPVESGKTLN